MRAAGGIGSRTPVSLLESVCSHAQKSMKDVEGCEKLWVAATQAITQRCPNEET